MALEIGSRLGHYDVTALIDEGGMGQVERPRFSWTRIKGESNVQGGGENGSVEGHGTGRGIGATGVRADDAAAGAGSLAPGQRWSASRPHPRASSRVNPFHAPGPSAIGTRIGPCDMPIAPCREGAFRRSMQHEPRMEVSWCDDVARV